MATKGERTRADIVSRTAELMNRHGFMALPVAAVIEATGIQKGGLYRHFESREALAYGAFDHAFGQVRERLLAAVGTRADACDQLLAMLAAYDGGGIDVPLAGGCPIMNTAIESDHADAAEPSHAGLRERAQQAMTGWHGLVGRIVETGQRAGQIRADVDPAQTATAFIACIEGGVMLTQLHRDRAHLDAARRHLEQHIERDLRARPPRPSRPSRPSSRSREPT